MSSKHKEKVKEMKGPDQFQTKGLELLAWLSNNMRLVVMALVPVAVAAGGFMGWQYYQKQQKYGRLEDLGKVQIVYEKEQRLASDQRQAIQKKIDEVEAKLEPAKAPEAAGQQPDNAPKPAAAPDPKLVAEKATLEKDLAAVKADHSGSTAQFLEFYKKYESTPEGWMAGMMVARQHVEQEKPQEARPILESVLKNSKDSVFYQTQARLTLVGVLEELADFDAALGEIDQLEKIVDKDLKPRVLLARGRILMLKNQKDEAKKALEALIENHGATPEAQKARSFKSLLN